MVQGILFDLDGVLVDTKQLHRDALLTALSEVGIGIGAEVHDRYLCGRPTAEKLAQLVSVGILGSHLVGAVSQRKKELTTEMLDVFLVRNEEHNQMFRDLRLSGRKIAVCSNAIRTTIERVLDISELEVFVDLILSAEDVIEAKPNPMIYRQAITALGLRANECLIIEDSDIGMAAAVGSGAHVHRVASSRDVTRKTLIDTIKRVEDAA
jgi:beta-phosphoglucomutase